MKITKDYIRELIKESLKEGGNFTPASLPYEVGQEDASSQNEETTTLTFDMPPEKIANFLFTMTNPNRLLGKLTYVFADKYPHLIPKDKQYLIRKK